MKEYIDNIQELKLKEIQLKKFKDEREAIISKYTRITTSSSPKIVYKCLYDEKKNKKVRKPCLELNTEIRGKNKKSEPTLECQIELEESGVDIEIKRLKKEIEKLNIVIREMRAPLKRLRGYTKRVYLYQLEGFSKTKAVEKVAEEDSVTTMTIWRQLKKIKKM